MWVQRLCCIEKVVYSGLKVGFEKKKKGHTIGKELRDGCWLLSC